MLENGDRIALGEQKLLYVDAPDLAPEMVRLTLTRNEGELPVEVMIPGTVTVLGRMEGDVLVDDDSVSSRHLEIENFGPGLRWVRDLGSTNGSALNGEPLDGRRRELKDGDVLTLGLVKIAVTDDGPPAENMTGAVQRTVIFMSDSALA
ncbi:MAG: FHA domain-containing protein [Deltaproteobacteria bacterium]|nr:MAG: FHA domain-containing protein [Deltaproteobacteria bacterium]